MQIEEGTMDCATIKKNIKIGEVIEVVGIVIIIHSISVKRNLQ